MHVTMIAAMARDRVIGTGSGGIPWHLPRDVARFREFTAGKHLLLGRRTYEEMSGWFSDHTPIVLTRNEEFRADPGRVARSVDEAITEAAEDGADELSVIGGASVYAAALPYADDLYLTRIEADVEGRARFPDYADGIEWETITEESFEADAANEFAMRFVHLRRVRPSSLRPSRFHRP